MANYFISSADRQGSCYYEFYMGAWDEENMQYWHKDSICISDDNFWGTGFETLVSEVVDDHDPYDNIPVAKEQWDIILQKAEEVGGELRVVVSEAANWAKENFKRHSVFTILGM